SKEVKALQAAGKHILNFTVGDFQAGEFRIPDPLTDLIIQHYKAGHTNYPPSTGEASLRQAVARFVNHELGLEYTQDHVLITGGSRPAIFGLYTTLLDPGDIVVYGVPSWNNNHYCHITGAVPRQVDTQRRNNFLLTAEELAPYIEEVVLVALNTPSNPTGTLYTATQLADICDLILAENEQRERRGAKPVYVMFDQMYYLMAYGNHRHVHPLGLRPEMAPYTIYIDGISKYLAATGVRVGWAIGPVNIIQKMSSLLGHMGAWAPRPEQLAVGTFLEMEDSLRGYIRQLNAKVSARLNKIHQAFQAWKLAGLPVDSVEPMGGLYLSVLFNRKGYRQPDGAVIKNAEMRRAYLLH
ncbi:MAG: pyridoxal phosphate-dependent aminotransferase, partial [Pseudomonadota bacterium]